MPNRDQDEGGDLGGDHARDPHGGGYGDDYARDGGWSGGGSADQHVREKPVPGDRSPNDEVTDEKTSE